MNRSSQNLPTASAVARLRPAGVRVLAKWALLAGAFAAFYVLYFAPVLFNHQTLGPGDGVVYYLAFFDLPILRTWNSAMLSGYPVINDIQAQTLYPLRWLSPDFNTMILSAYVLSALGMFGLSLKLTGSRWGALLAAVAVSGSGFMIAHLGHLSIVHVAAWVPFVLWALACLRNARSHAPVVWGALAVAMSMYAGHPQISIIGLLLAGCYGVHEIAAVGRLRGFAAAGAMLWRVTAMFALGLMLAAPALLALSQSLTDGVRSDWTIQDFNSFSLTPGTLRLLAFPNLYGTYAGTPFGGYVNQATGNLTEIAVYVGILPGLLTMAALLGWRRDRSHWFWIAAAALALLLSLGTSTPLGRLVYELPVLGKFRAQGRFGMVVVIAMGVLSAYGVSALLRAPWPRRRLIALAAGAGLLIALAVGSVLLDPIPPNAMGEPLEASLWPRPAFWGALLLMALSLLALAALALRRSPAAALACALLAAVDVASFGWFDQWRYRASDKLEMADLDPRTAQAVATLAKGEGRLLPLAAADMPHHPLRPNINVRFGIPSVVGYGPLMSARYSKYTRADSVGRFPITDPDAPIMDVLAIRWLAGRSASLGEQLLGAGCGAPTPIRRKLRAELPEGVPVSALRVVSHAGCSVEMTTGAPLVRIRLFDADGAQVGEQSIDVGEETAEWAYDRPDVAASVKHARAPVVDRFPVEDYQGLWYQADLPVTLAPGSRPPRTVELEIAPEQTAILRLRSLALIKAPGAQAQPLALDPDVESAARELAPRWNVPGLPPIFERKDYRGMAWGVCAARVASLAQIAEALGSHQLADGRRFDPFAEALLEYHDGRARADCRAAPKVDVLDKRDGYWKLRVRGDGASLAMISESYHRDWRARVDGHKAPAFPADGLIMAVPVPAGEHVLELSFKPRRFRIGLGIAAIAAFACLLLALAALRASARSRTHG